MAFRFALASLLRLRSSIEHQRELLLQAANHQLEDIRRKIASAERTAQLMRDRREQELSGGLAASQVHFALLCESILSEYRRRLEDQRVKAAELCAQRAQEFRRARRDREILDTLREDELHSYLEKQDRRQQRELDDLLLIRQAKRRG